MFSSVMSAAILGVEAYQVSVEADMANGLPGFAIVGCPSTQVRESQERVRTALKNSGFILPPKKVTINLAPAGLRKEGTGFDLAVAAAILLADGKLPEDSLHQIMVAGELGLDGQVRKISGVLPMALLAQQCGCRAFIVPAENTAEGRRADGLRIIGIKTLRQLTEFCESGIVPEEETVRIVREKTEEVDFSDIAGQDMAKRAALLAAAGFHNFLMIGQPGSGKTMIARRIAGILPRLDREESLEIMKIQSVAGLLAAERADDVKRPFRAPHHSLSMQSLTGGGRIPIPGEVTLAHRGVLFLGGYFFDAEKSP